MEIKGAFWKLNQCRTFDANQPLHPIMQKSIFILLATAITFLLQSCSSSSYVPQQNIRVAEFTREEISLMDQASGSDKSIRIYLLGSRYADEILTGCIRMPTPVLPNSSQGPMEFLNLELNTKGSGCH